MVKNGINYLIDKKMIAVDIILLLEGEYFLKHPFLKVDEYSYLDEVRTFFNNFIHHEAVNYFHNHWEEYGYDLVYKKTMNDENDPLGKMIDRFMQESHFNLFYEENLSYFDNVMEKNLDQMKNIDWIHILDQTYGKVPGTIEVYFSFISGGVGYNISQMPNNKIALGIFSFEDGVPIFLDPDYTLNMIFHECSHGYINPIIEELPLQQTLITHYYESMHPQIQKIYGASKNMIAEQFVRGFTLHFLQEVDQRLYEEQKQKEISFGNELALEIAEDLSHQEYLNYSDYMKEMLSKITPKIELNSKNGNQKACLE